MRGVAVARKVVQVRLNAPSLQDSVLVDAVVVENGETRQKQRQRKDGAPMRGERLHSGTR